MGFLKGWGGWGCSVLYPKLPHGTVAKDYIELIEMLINTVLTDTMTFRFSPCHALTSGLSISAVK